MNKEIGQRIKKLREQKNLSQLELAKLLGYSNNSIISKIENGDTEVSIHQMDKLKGIFGVSIEYLYYGVDEKNVINKKDEITKTVNVITNFNKMELIHFVYLGIIFGLLLLSFFLKNKVYQSSLLLIILVVISFIVVTIIKGKNDINKYVETYNIPENKQLVYRNSLTDVVTRRYKKDKILIFSLMVVLDIFFYGIIVTEINKYEKSLLLPAILIVLVLGLIITKIVFMIIPTKGEIINYTKGLFITFSLQMILTLLSFLMLTIIDLNMPKELFIFGGFNLVVFIFAIIANNYIMSKYYFSIE